MKQGFPKSFNWPQPETGPAQNGLKYSGHRRAKQLLVSGSLATDTMLVASVTDQSIAGR